LEGGIEAGEQRLFSGAMYRYLLEASEHALGCDPGRGGSR
jgi:hypothetical protein